MNEYEEWTLNEEQNIYMKKICVQWLIVLCTHHQTLLQIARSQLNNYVENKNNIA